MKLYRFYNLDYIKVAKTQTPQVPNWHLFWNKTRTSNIKLSCLSLYLEKNIFFLCLTANISLEEKFLTTPPNFTNCTMKNEGLPNQSIKPKVWIWFIFYGVHTHSYFHTIKDKNKQSELMLCENTSGGVTLNKILPLI